MTRFGRTTLISLTALLVVSGFIALFWMTLAMNTDKHLRIQSLFLKIKNIHTRIDRDALRVSLFKLENYDGFVDAKNSLRKMHQVLVDILPEGREEDVAELMNRFEVYLSLHDKKIRLLEKLLSSSALSRNSLRYLTTASEKRNIQGHEAGDLIDRLIARTMAYTIFNDPQYSREIAGFLVKAQSIDVPFDERKYLDTILRHVNVNLVASDKLSRAISGILSVDIEMAVDAVDQRYTDWYDRESIATNMYRFILLALSTGLLVALITAGWRMRIAYAEMEDRIEERTHDLRENKEEAEAANHAKSEFLAIMNHELRTPLNAINGFSEMMKLETFGPLSKKYMEYANDIHNAGKHLLQVINNLLDISKIEAGSHELHEEALDIKEEVNQLVKLLVGRTMKNAITISMEIPQVFPPLWADRLNLKQMLLNLLTNAIKFTQKEGQIIIEGSLNEDGAILLKVKDTGIGIAKEELPKVLKAFGQVDDIMVRNQEGTGLGVPLTKSLMELHGGTLEVESEVGVGTTVCLIFPPERTLRDS